jgi:hypothetical protein
MLEVVRPAPSWQWQQWFQTMSHYSSSTLEHLDIILEEDEDDMMGHEALLPLFTFQNLTHLSLTCDVDNDLLKEMAQAWPCL